MNPALNRIRRACRALDEGRPEGALEVLEEAATPARVIGDGTAPVNRGLLQLLEEPSQRQSVVNESISLAAQGLIFERQGLGAEADRCFERVLANGVPLRTLLQVAGRYFKRTDRYESAYQCYSILQNFIPGAVNEFLRGLPAEELARYSPWVVRQVLDMARPGHWFLPPVKRALVTEFGPEAAATVFARLARKGPGWTVATMPVTSLRDFAREHGASYEEVIRSRSVRMSPPPVFGAEEEAGFEARTRTVFFSVLTDVVVSSKSNLLLSGDRALLDFQDDELERFPIDLDVDPIAFAPREDAVTVLIDGGANAGDELERAMSLVGVNSYNFGHWLVEFLPKVFACLDRPGFDSVPLVVDDQMHPQLRPALEFFVGADHPIVVLKRGEASLVRSQWSCTMPKYFPLGGTEYGPDSPPRIPVIDGDAFAGLISKVGPKVEEIGAPTGPKRIYLTRKSSQHRTLVNGEEVEGWFVDRDFEVFDLGEHPFEEQLTLIRGADLIVGPDGSSLWISFFARRGTRVGYLNNPYLDDHWWIAAACRSLGHHLSILTGDVVRENRGDLTKSDYQIDTNSLPAFLDELLTEG